MNAKNRELLSDVIQKKLEYALNSVDGSDEEKAALKAAMEAIDRETTISKNDDSYAEHGESLEVDKAKLDIDREKLELDRARVELEEKKVTNTHHVDSVKLDIESEKVRNDFRVDKAKIKVEDKKIKVEEAANEKESKFRNKELLVNLGRWSVELVAIYILKPRIDNAAKKAFAELCMVFEKEDSFTSTPGRAISQFFKFKD